MEISVSAKQKQFETVFGNTDLAFKTKLARRLGDFPTASKFLNAATPPSLDPVFFWHYLAQVTYDLQTVKNALNEAIHADVKMKLQTLTTNFFDSMRDIAHKNGLLAPSLSDYEGYFIFHGILASPEYDISVVDFESMQYEGIYPNSFIMASEKHSKWNFKLLKDATFYIIPFSQIKLKLNDNYIMPNGRIYKISEQANTEINLEFFSPSPFVFTWISYTSTPSITFKIKTKDYFEPLYPSEFSLVRDEETYVYSFTVEYLDMPVMGAM